jgi:hypothetical protein
LIQFGFVWFDAVEEIRLSEHNWQQQKHTHKTMNKTQQAASSKNGRTASHTVCCSDCLFG